MTIDRTTIIHGPALITYGGQTFWSRGDVVVKPTTRRFTVETAAHGKLQERNIDLRIDVTFEPAGNFTTALADVLWPYVATYPGTSIFGSTDAPLVIHGVAGDKLTIANAAVTQMPSIRFGTNKTTIGPVRFTGLVGKGLAPQTLASYWAWASAAYPGDTGFDPATIWTPAAGATWGSITGFATSFTTESGWEVAIGTRLSEVVVDGIGTVDMKLVGIDCAATATPVGPTAAQVMAALHAAAAPGSAATVGELAIGSGAVYAPNLQIHAAFLSAADVGHGTGRKRVGPCTWTACRTFSAYSAGPPVIQAAMYNLFSIYETA